MYDQLTKCTRHNYFHTVRNGCPYCHEESNPRIYSTGTMIGDEFSWDWDDKMAKEEEKHWEDWHDAQDTTDNRPA